MSENQPGEVRQGRPLHEGEGFGTRKHARGKDHEGENSGDDGRLRQET